MGILSNVLGRRKLVRLEGTVTQSLNDVAMEISRGKSAVAIQFNGLSDTARKVASAIINLYVIVPNLTKDKVTGALCDGYFNNTKSAKGYSAGGHIIDPLLMLGFLPICAFPGKVIAVEISTGDVYKMENGRMINMVLSESNISQELLGVNITPASPHYDWYLTHCNVITKK